MTSFAHMKKLVTILLAFAAAGTLACSADEIKYDITGTGAPKDGAAVYLIDQTSLEPIDSAVVSSGTFRMKGKADKDAFLAIAVDGLEVNSFLRSGQFPLFNDGKPVKLNVAEGTLTGSALNTKLSECNKRNKAAYAEYYSLIEEMESLPEDSSEEKIAEMMSKYRKAINKYADFYVRIIEENKDNLIPIAFVEHLPSVVSAADNWNKELGEQKLDEVLASNAALAKHPYALDLKRRMAAADAKRKQNADHQRSVVGEKFRDLEEPDPDGNPHKLSEYVGQGKWVLVDFWASWCGPCKAEMPNVTAAYKKYHSKGFEIVGLSFDQDKDAWVRAIKEWDMPWIHLSDLKRGGSVAAGVYSVTGIPDNLLIDPEGTIVARGLRGDELDARLAEIFK